MRSRELRDQERRTNGTPGVDSEGPSDGVSRPSGRGLSSLLKLVISLALLALILSRVGWRETVRTLSGAHLPYLLAALAVHLVSIVGRALRWRLLVDALGMRFSLSRLTELYFVGAFFSTFLPTEVGGDVVRGRICGRLWSFAQHRTLHDRDICPRGTSEHARVFE